MAGRRDDGEFRDLEPLLDQLGPLEPDEHKVDGLVAFLTAAMPQEEAPAADEEWPLFLGLCAGVAVVFTLVFLATVLEISELYVNWIWPIGAIVGIASLGVLGAVVLQRRSA